MKWISINDSLPEFDRDVLVSIEGKTPFVIIMSLGSKQVSASGVSLNWNTVCDSFFIQNNKVKWWMPLPEPATIPENV